MATKRTQCQSSSVWMGIEWTTRMLYLWNGWTYRAPMQISTCPLIVVMSGGAADGVRRIVTLGHSLCDERYSTTLRFASWKDLHLGRLYYFSIRHLLIHTFAQEFPLNFRKFHPRHWTKDPEEKDQKFGHTHGYIKFRNRKMKLFPCSWKIVRQPFWNTMERKSSFYSDFLFPRERVMSRVCTSLAPWYLLLWLYVVFYVSSCCSSMCHAMAFIVCAIFWVLLLISCLLASLISN